MKKALCILLALGLLLCCGCAREGAKEDDMKETTLVFSSFDGGGPSYRAVVEDASLVSVTQRTEYGRRDHAEIDGAAFEVVFTLRGLRPGETRLTVEERSPIAGNFDRLYALCVAEDLSVSVRELSVTDLDALAQPTATLVLETEQGTLYADFADTAAAAELRERLSQGPLALELHDYGGFEKTGALGFALPASDERITAKPGDLCLYRGDQLSLFYGENTWDYTLLATVHGGAEELASLLGEGDLTVCLWIEWSE